MPNLSPEETFESMKTRVAAAIRGQFPQQGKTRRIELVDITFAERSAALTDAHNVDNIEAQYKARTQGQTWGVSARATLRMVELPSGNELEKKTVTLAKLPKLTRRYSYIVKGQERQHDSLFRLKPRPYHRIASNGEIQARWNLARGFGFDLKYEPGRGRITMRVGTSHISLYSILNALGVSDAAMQRAWGATVYDVNLKAARPTADVGKLYKSLSLRPPNMRTDPNYEGKVKAIRRYFSEETEVWPGAMKSAFGKAYTNVNGENLLLSSKRLLSIQKGRTKEDPSAAELPDDRESLTEKYLATTEDFLVEALHKKTREINRKIKDRIDRPDATLDDIIGSNIYSKVVLGVFDYSQRPDQTNPLQFVSGYMRTTIRGKAFGGVGSGRVNLANDKLINPSHLGFLDPIQTPECWPGHAEVFTKRGWVRWDAVTEGDEFLCQFKDSTFFEVADKLHVSHWDGDLYCMDQGKIAYEVTPSHRMWVSTPWRPDVWRFITADKVHGKERRFDTGHEATVGEFHEFTLPTIPGNNSSKNVTEPIDMTDWAEFMGWFLSEGCTYYREDGKNSRYNVRISQVRAVNPGEYERIEALLDRLPFNWHWDGKDLSFGISTKQLAHYCRQFGKAHEKFIPEYLFHAHRDAREALLESLLLGDGRVGSVRADGRSYDQLVYTTTSPKLAEDVERLAATLGWPTRVSQYADSREERYRDVYEIRLLQHRYRTARPRHPNYPAEFSRKKYTGNVYCATVTGGKLYCRMPGRVGFWSGNSDDTGIALQLPLGVKVRRAAPGTGKSQTSTGQELTTRVYDKRKHKWVYATPADLEHENVAYPDQIKWVEGRPYPLDTNVVCYDKARQTTKRAWREVRYVLPSSKALFSFSANLVPFMQNNSGGRVMMAAKQQEQALSLADGRQAPLVQVKADGSETFEGALGSLSSHRAPQAGTITRIERDAIYLRPTGSRKTIKIPIYDHYPLNGGKGVMDAEPVVKVGQRVKKDQLLADTNFTKGGALALGSNLKVAYIPYKGLNFEDGIVCSESAAKQMSSAHMHQSTVTVYPGMRGGKEGDLAAWVDYALPEKSTPERIAKLDSTGVVKDGTRLQRGDIVIAVLSPRQAVKEDEILTRIKKSLVKPFKDRAVTWDHDYPGEVVKIIRSPGTQRQTITVHVRTVEPLIVGDKLTGRHGNKGIISRIIPDDEMPRNKAGEHMQLLLNPAGVPSRMNIGQVLETAASKIARKTGKPYIIENFVPGVDYSQKVLNDLKKHGLSDTEELFDATTGRSLGPIMAGHQYILKLHHTVEKKVTARSYGGYTGSGDAPSGAGVPGGGQKMDMLSTYAMLAHGARHNLREAYTFKSDGEQDEVWDAVMTGRPLPPPRPTRGMTNFLAYLKAMGINTEKKGDKYMLMPLTDAQVVGGKGSHGISNGELPMPDKMLYAKGALTKEETQGLFDPKVTGGMDGPYWSHITLAERMPSPLFEPAIQALLGVTRKEYARLVGPTLNEGGGSGFTEISRRLGAINVEKELEAAKLALPKLKAAKLNLSYKRIRYLQALKKSGMKPLDAYTNKVLPVIPPKMRKVSIGLDGSQILDDLNGLYLSVGRANMSIRRADPATPKEDVEKSRAHLYESIRGLRMTGMTLGRRGGQRHHTGLLEKLTGNIQGVGAPKFSFFQRGVLSRRQDLSGRSTIVPEPDMGLDEVGLPEPLALEMYRPFVVRELFREGTAPLEADKLVDKKHPRALHALRRVVSERPVMLKRDPALHKFSIMAFRPKIVSGKAVQIHPLVTGGFNADFDGDSIALYVPVSQEAVDEARRMMPSKNLFSPTHYGLMPVPAQDSLLGLYQATKWDKLVGVPTGTTGKQAIQLMNDGKLKPSDVITIGGKKTTAGRLLLNQDLPKEMRGHKKLLYDPEYRLRKGELKAILATVARKHPQHFPMTVDAWKDHGNRLSYLNGSSFSIKDFHDGKNFRDYLLKDVKAEEDRIRKKKIPRKRKEQEVIALYTKARKNLEKHGKERYDRDSTNRMWEWAQSGARGGWNQFSQLVFGPMLVTDPSKKTVPVPINRSYGEGLNLSQYWASMHGARKGTLDRAAGTREPGALTKDIINTVMNTNVTADDCNTTQGVSISPSDKDATDRYLAKRVSLKDGTAIEPGTLLTGHLTTRIQNSGITRIIVRSPLHCKMPRGICGKCFGLNERGQHHAVGVNVGVIAGHALGEPVTQLTMRTFHTGGVAGSGGVVDAFKRVKQLFMVPDNLPNSAVLATTAGAITGIKKDHRGGYTLHVGTKEHRIVTGQLLPGIVQGASVRRGQALSTGPINPKHMLEQTKSMGKVRAYMTDEIEKAYGGMVRRRNIETVVKSMTNLTAINSAPAHTGFLRGQVVPLAQIEAMNTEAREAGDAVVRHTPQLKAMTQLPLAGQEDWLARLNYQRLKETYQEGAAQGWSSDIHGHPISGLAHGAEFGLRAPTILKSPKKSAG